LVVALRVWYLVVLIFFVVNLGFGAFSCSCVHISFLVSFLGYRALSCTRVHISFLVSFWVWCT
jgi:hypothetical protein